MEHLEQSIELMKRHNHYDPIEIRLTAVYDNLRQIAINRQLQQSTQYTDWKYLVKKGPKENSRVEHVGDKEGVRCVSCGSKSHLIGFCLSIRVGELRYCPGSPS
jgi:hypothetical protein